MKANILVAGQGTRSRPLKDHVPRCMIKINGKTIIKRTLDTMFRCGLKEEYVYIVGGHHVDALQEFKKRSILSIIQSMRQQIWFVLLCVPSQGSHDGGN